MRNIFVCILIILSSVMNAQSLISNFSGSERPVSAPGIGSGETQTDPVLSKRKNYLSWHQTMGLVTWASWLATNLAGEQARGSFRKEYEPYANLAFLLNPSQNAPLYYYIMKSSPWDSDDSQRRLHSTLGLTTFALYSATAFLSFTAPSKEDTAPEPGWSSIFTHKAMILIHLPAMLAMPYYSSQIHSRGPEAVNGMRNAGWIGFSALSIAMFTFYF